VIRDPGGPAVKYLHGSGMLSPRLEQALENHRVGDIVSVRLLPDDAFGKRKVELLCQVPLQDFPQGKSMEVGGTVVGKGEDGDEVNFLITDISGGIAHLDGNHPLAGQSLMFKVEVQGIRDASAEEISQGTALD
jgi:FKBP-type peptidyl-prolyl cis-trans isomerase SlyD